MRHVLFVCNHNAGRAPVRSFVLPIVQKRARACLRAEVCEPAAV